MTRAPAHAARTGWAAAAVALMAGGVITVVGAANAGEPASLPAAGVLPAAVAAVPAAPGDSATTTIDSPDGPRTLSAEPVSGLPASGAQITVNGTGFDTTGDLWIAVCQDDGAAPASLIHCLGGPIPDFNASSSWGVVTADGQAPFAGPVAAKWRGNGSFKITLQLLAASGQDADCLTGSCSVYLRSADDDDRSDDASLPIRFTAPSTGTAPPTTTAVMSTETIGGVETTVGPDSLGGSSVPAGEEQTVAFSGFTPGEKVDVTLYSDPIELPPTQADDGGMVTIAFQVPEDLPVGEHLVQAVGRKSGVVGIAQFSVTEAAVTETSDTESTETEATESTEGMTEESAESATTDSAELSTETAAPTTETPATETTEQSDAMGAGGADDSDGSNRSLWLLIALIAIVVIGSAAGLVVMLRRRREDDLPLVAAQPADMAGPGGYAAESAGYAPDHGGYAAEQAGYGVRPSWQAEPPPVTSWQPEQPWQPGEPPTAAEPGWAPSADHWTGLFGDSGARENPYQGPPAPSSGGAPGGPAGVTGDPGAAPQDAEGPATEQWRPDWTESVPPEPGVQGWGPVLGSGSPSDTPDSANSRQFPPNSPQYPPQDPPQPPQGRHYRHD